MTRATPRRAARPNVSSAGPVPGTRPTAVPLASGEWLRAVLATVLACVIWALSGIWYHALNHLPAPEILAHRTIWSVVFFALILTVQGRLGTLLALLRDGRAMRTVVFAASVIGLNWGLFIYAVGSGQALEASLGYYIFPLIAVLLGMMLLGERLGALQLVAIGLVALAVLVLTLGLGAPPWMALALAFTFGAYGLAKRRLAAGPVVSVCAEVVVIAPLAIVWLAGVHLAGWTGTQAPQSAAFGTNWRDSLLLIGMGPLTAGPLMLFSYAAKRLSYTTQGLISYLNPTLQFVVAVLVFGEMVTPWHALAFPVIWAALILYSYASWRKGRAARSA